MMTAGPVAIMRFRLASIIVGLCLLSACAEEPEPLSYGPPPLETGFAPDRPDVAVVVLRDRQPVEKAELVDAEGHWYPIDAVSHVNLGAQPSGGIPPQIALGASGGSAGVVSAGVGVGFPIFGSEAPSPDTLVASTFSIRIPNMDNYRMSWPHWKFRVTLGSPTTSERAIEFAAPRPPSAS
jgi:hypothetical protein